jgi:hypothetical protein
VSEAALLLGILIIQHWYIHATHVNSCRVSINVDILVPFTGRQEHCCTYTGRRGGYGYVGGRDYLVYYFVTTGIGKAAQVHRSLATDAKDWAGELISGQTFIGRIFVGFLVFFV